MFIQWTLMSHPLKQVYKSVAPFSSSTPGLKSNPSSSHVNNPPTIVTPTTHKFLWFRSS